MSPSVVPPSSRWKALASRVLSPFSPPPAGGRARVRLPEGLRTIYAIGDVHGHLDHLLRLEQVIAKDVAAREGPALLLLLGDFVNRGPRSADTLAHLAAPPNVLPRLCLCGNHESEMLAFLERPSEHHSWLGMGGSETLAAYGLDIGHVFSTYRRRPEQIVSLLAEAIPREQVEFLRSLPVLAYDDHFVFVHAGVRPGVPLERQKESDLLWIREPFLSEGPGWSDRVVVHGHTVTRTIRLDKGRIGIDHGVHRSGELVALRLSADGLFTLSSKA